MSLAILLSALTFVASLAGATISAFKFGTGYVIGGVIAGSLIGYVFSTISHRSTAWMHGKYDIDSKSPSKAQSVGAFFWHLLGYVWVSCAALSSYFIMQLVEHLTHAG